MYAMATEMHPACARAWWWIVLFSFVCPASLASQRRIECRTRSCSPFDNWEPAPYENSSELCKAVPEKAIEQFAFDAPRECRSWASAGLGAWGQCRKNYCSTLGKIQADLQHKESNIYYGGTDDQCRPLMNFNQSLCESDYRDADGFCNCICPMMNLLASGGTEAGCQAAIINFLLLGRKGIALSQRFGLNGYCSRILCDFFMRVGEPDPPYPLAGLPPTCLNLDLPWRLYNCVELLSQKPYNPEPWTNSSGEDDVLECTDGTRHKVEIRNIDTWDICNQHRYRWKCPKNYPVMCHSERDCAGDHCCRQTADQCVGGKVRIPSVVTSLQLAEWIGEATPQMLLKWATTTTMDPYSKFLANAPTTTYAPSAAEQVKDVVWIAVALVGTSAGVCFFILCIYLGNVNIKTIGKLLIGPARLFSIYGSDPVGSFLPSGNIPRDKKREAPLPPLRPLAEIEAERLDAEACQMLENCWTAASFRGFRHLVRYAGQPELTEAEPLRKAITWVRTRGLQNKTRNAEIIRTGEKWLATLEAEAELQNVTEAARPDLRWTAQARLTQGPVQGKPWIATTLGRAADGQIRKEGWKHIEELREAIQVASRRDVSEVILTQARSLLSELVARTPELPADRCVLDPEGDGIKLLPKGQQRAVWSFTGDVYCYDADSAKAGELEETPPRELLGDVGVDDARPVCAEWAKSFTCKAGRECPWRHVRPKPGDTIRECILFD